MNILILIFTLLFASPAWAVPVFDNVTNGAYIENVNQSFALNTIAGSNRYALACGTLYVDTSTVNANFPKINGVSMTLLGSATRAAGSIKTFLYELIAPATGTPTFEIETTGTTAQEWIISTYTNVHQTTPSSGTATANGVSELATVNVTSAAGQLVVDCLGMREGDELTALLVIGAGQTQRGTHETNLFWIRKLSEEAGAGTVTMSWDWTGGLSQHWTIIGTSLQSPPTTKKSQVIIVE